jgi:CTP synthase
VTIAVVGKYIDHQDAYKSLAEALKHGGLRQRTRVKLKWLESQDVERDGGKALAGVDGILVPGGFGDRGFEGKVLTAQHAREQASRISASATACRPRWWITRDTCSAWPMRNSTENDKQSAHPVIGLITEWRTASGDVERRSENSRPGRHHAPGSAGPAHQARHAGAQAVRTDVVGERHRHRYEFNNRYRTQLEDAGLVISAKSMDDLLVEMIELPQAQHPWFLACQAHPEFLSTPRDGHPLFIGFIRAAREHKAQAGGRLLKEATA